MVVDKNGIEIKSGQIVLVHNDILKWAKNNNKEGIRTAVVVQPFPDSPTVNAPGHWVDIDIDKQGVEGMPSYILEVTN